MSASHYSLFGLTETWLDSNVFDSELFCSDFTVFRRDRNFNMVNSTRGGGVLLALKKPYNAIVLDLSNVTSLAPTVDILGIKISLSSRSLLVFIVYIPPNTGIEIYEAIFDALRDVIFLNDQDDLILLGDFNIPDFVNHMGDPYYINRRIMSIVNFSEFMGLKQCNGVLNSNQRILDLVFSRSTVHTIKSENYLLPVDDHHPPLEFLIKTNSVKFEISYQPRITV